MTTITDDTSSKAQISSFSGDVGVVEPLLEVFQPHTRITDDMVSDLLIGGLTVLGGAISGIIGVLYSEFQSRRERQKNLKEWYSTMTL